MSWRARQLAWALGGVLASACAAEPPREVARETPPPPLTGATPQERLRQFAEGALIPEDATRAGLRAQYGAPDSSNAVPTANRHIPEQTDTIVTVHYPGLEVQLYRTADARDLVQRVDVSANRWLRYAPGVGAIATAVQQALGTPAEATDSTLAFVCVECSPVAEPITFFLSDDRVRRVRFAFYVD